MSAEEIASLKARIESLEGLILQKDAIIQKLSISMKDLSGRVELLRSSDKTAEKPPAEVTDSLGSDQQASSKTQASRPTTDPKPEVMAPFLGSESQTSTLPTIPEASTPPASPEGPVVKMDVPKMETRLPAGSPETRVSRLPTIPEVDGSTPPVSPEIRPPSTPTNPEKPLTEPTSPEAGASGETSAKPKTDTQGKSPPDGQRDETAVQPVKPEPQPETPDRSSRSMTESSSRPSTFQIEVLPQPPKPEPRSTSAAQTSGQARRTETKISTQVSDQEPEASPQPSKPEPRATIAAQTSGHPKTIGVQVSTSQPVQFETKTVGQPVAIVTRVPSRKTATESPRLIRPEGRSGSDSAIRGTDVKRATRNQKSDRSESRSRLRVSFQKLFGIRSDAGRAAEAPTNGRSKQPSVTPPSPRLRGRVKQPSGSSEGQMDPLKTAVPSSIPADTGVEGNLTASLGVLSIAINSLTKELNLMTDRLIASSLEQTDSDQECQASGSSAREAKESQRGGARRYTALSEAQDPQTLSGRCHSVLVDDKIWIFSKKEVDQLSFNRRHAVSFTGGFSTYFDLTLSGWASDKPFGALATEENTAEILFVFNKRIYLLLYTEFGGPVFRKLFEWRTERRDWREIKFVVESACQASENLNSRSSMIAVQQMPSSKSSSMLLVSVSDCVGNRDFAMYRLVFNAAHSAASLSLIGANAVQEHGNYKAICPLFAARFRDMVFILGSVHGDGFKPNWLIAFDESAKEFILLEMEGDYPLFRGDGTIQTALLPSGEWLHVYTTTNRAKGVFSSEVWILELHQTPPRWTRSKCIVEEAMNIDEMIVAMRDDGSIFAADNERIVIFS